MGPGPRVVFLIAELRSSISSQVRYYGHKHSLLAATAMTLGLAALLGGLEVGIVFGIKVGPIQRSGSRFSRLLQSVYHDGTGNARPVQFTGIFAAILISLALL